MDIRPHLMQQDNELREAIRQLDEQYAWAKARGYNALARAYLVGQAELLRNKEEIIKLVRLTDGAQ